ncbi:uncharacterized protein BP01DRAFT_163487 [Aspergillus saccharolyticus JOP 1030-1]|uniref:Uncharacterized protein n=1 Tax=Aspergillus saccharolyticus JOP 1030-1 TaxID=1450539 RepID=A0A318Z5R6_9EURO|nr:hypothetical protein BP01DRAFT_163487 [Aspergillus saccharolyticus JOP 1030-1]PYH41697.1 hypothetical protein BP01DRAFT_163487 [Aspergillus saccharolyticus JOP 1030-1]
MGRCKAEKHRKARPSVFRTAAAGVKAWLTDSRLATKLQGKKEQAEGKQTRRRKDAFSGQAKVTGDEHPLTHSLSRSVAQSLNRSINYSLKSLTVLVGLTDPARDEGRKRRPWHAAQQTRSSNLIRSWEHRPWNGDNTA